MCVMADDYITWRLAVLKLYLNQSLVKKVPIISKQVNIRLLCEWSNIYVPVTHTLSCSSCLLCLCVSVCVRVYEAVCPHNTVLLNPHNSLAITHVYICLRLVYLMAAVHIASKFLAGHFWARTGGASQKCSPLLVPPRCMF